MKDRIEFIRLAIVLLVLFFIGKLVVGALGGSYDLGIRLVAMVPMTIHLALLWGAMTRAFRGEGKGSAFITGACIALVAQLLIFSGTMLSYLLGVSTHFNEPMAIVGADQEVTLGQAFLARVGGVVFNPILGGIAGLIGWALGGLIPSKKAA